MSGSTCISSEMNHQSQPPATPSSAIKIINPETKAEITLATSKGPVRTLSPALKSIALKIALFLKHDDFPSTKYPVGFASSDPAINAKSSPRGFHYDFDYLYQFKDIYKDKSSEDWDAIIKEIMDGLDARVQRLVSGPSRTVSAAGLSGPKAIQEIYDDVSPC